MGRSTSVPRFLAICWLALLLAGAITGDFVEDLVFESMEVGDMSETVPLSEDPDEHILMPSARAASPGDIHVLQLSAHAEPHLCCLEPFATHVAQSASHYPCKPRPPSSIQVLRI